MSKKGWVAPQFMVEIAKTAAGMPLFQEATRWVASNGGP